MGRWHRESRCVDCAILKSRHPTISGRLKWIHDGHVTGTFILFRRALTGNRPLKRSRGMQRAETRLMAPHASVLIAAADARSGLLQHCPSWSDDGALGRPAAGTTGWSKRPSFVTTLSKSSSQPATKAFCAQWSDDRLVLSFAVQDGWSLSPSHVWLFTPSLPKGSPPCHLCGERL